MRNVMLLTLLLCLTFAACDWLDGFLPHPHPYDQSPISELQFVDEWVIPDGELFEGEVVGGLSGIDYAGGIYYLLSDAPSAPIRYYQAGISFDENGFSSIELLNQVELLAENGQSFGDTQADPEAIRFDTKIDQLVWCSEGYVADPGVDPFIRRAGLSGNYAGQIEIPAKYKATTATDAGPRSNGTFEGLALSQNGNGYWVAMELPLVQDGPAPIYGTDTESPVRIAYIDRSTGEFGGEFAYELDPVSRDGGFTINGVVELLEYAPKRFLVLERSFATGYDDGGNNVRIYEVDARVATNVADMDALQSEDYEPAKKKLLFDFEEVRDQLSTVPGGEVGIVDNIEGMTFGPDLPNGNRSLLLVADNNFSAFGPQLNQFILLEVMP